MKAATGEVISAEELGGAETHGRKSGVVDHVGGHSASQLPDTRATPGRKTAPYCTDAGVHPDCGHRPRI